MVLSRNFLFSWQMALGQKGRFGGFKGRFRYEMGICGLDKGIDNVYMDSRYMLKVFY